MSNSKVNHDDQLITRFLSGETSRDETKEIIEWLLKDEKNFDYFNSIRRTWDAVDDKESIKKIDREKAKKEFLKIIDAENNIPDNEQKTPLRSSKIATGQFLKIAAVIVLIGGLTFALKYIVQHNRLILESTQHKILGYTLPDGSKVSLNLNTNLAYPTKYKNDQREVHLNKGEAFFDIVPDKEHPFIVYTDHIAVKVVGTSFNIKAYEQDDSITITVNTGNVILCSAGKGKTGLIEQVVLTEGEAGVYTKNVKTFNKAINTDLNYLAWMTGELSFYETELKEVFEVLMKNYHVKIEVVNKKIYQCKLTADFKNQSIDSIFEILKKIFNIEVEKRDDVFIISGEGC